MQKVCATLLVISLVSSYEALPQTKWSRPISNSQGQLTRERRQFPFGEWIPLSQPCPTCRPFADPLDAGLRSENIGLTPPRPPTVTRQIHGEGNFFGQDESSILSVPPPPPSAIPRNPFPGSNTNFQFQNFAQFNNPLPRPTQQNFPQTQQIQFLPQTFLPNQPLLVNGNQQILPVLNSANTLFGQDNQVKQQISNGKVTKFNSEFKQQQKVPENVVLEQNKRPPVPSQPFSNKPTPFAPQAPQQQQQQQPQTFVQQQQQQPQTFVQQHQSLSFSNSILTPPPAPNATAQDIVIPGLDKEEIQLLYVPVETLRQRGTFQEQLLTQDPQNIQFHNRPSVSQRPASTIQSAEQLSTKEPKGHFVTQNVNNQGSSISSVKVTSPQPFPTTATPSTQFIQRLPFQQTPQPFVSATPATPTIQPFVTPSPFTQKFSSFSPETTLSHLVTVPNTINQFSQSDIQFGTTPKPSFGQEGFQGGVVNDKSQFSTFKSTPFQNFQQTQRPFQSQSFVSQQQEQQNTVFGVQGQLKDVEIQTQIPQKQLIDQQQITFQQEQQRLLQQQKEKELQEEQLLKQRQQKELEAQRLLQQQKQKELEEQRYLEQQKRQKEIEEQRLLQQQRQKELEEQRFLQQQRQKELDEQRFFQQQRQKELDEQRFLQQQRQKELENQRRLQQQRQNELEEKRRLQLQQQREQEEQQRLLRIQQQQREHEEQQRRLRIQQQQRQQEEQERLLRLQQQQKELEQKRLQQQQEEQQRLLQQQQLQRQKIAQQQVQDQQTNRHVLPDNDKLNLISQLEKESEPENSQLVPHQPPLSVFFRGFEGGEPRITDVLRELRRSNTITVLDQYFEKMPKVFVGPAGLIPPAGYRKFELPYLSNLETNRIERKIDRLPFFVAPLNFVPPPGYSKIPFPAPHVGSVVVSSESNPAMKLQLAAKENNVGSVPEDDGDSGSFPMVGPELPGLINSLERETTTLRPTTFPSTPSLPQTTAQLRNRRPNNSLYRTQNRKPYTTKTRPQTTSKPEEEVTQKVEVTKEPEGGIRSSINRFLKRRRQPVKTTTTTENYVKAKEEGKNLENRHYSVEVYHNQKNTNVPRYQQKGLFQNKQNVDHTLNGRPIDRTTPDDQGIYEVQPTPGFYKVQPTGVVAEPEEQKPTVADYSDPHNLQTFEDGPLPTGSAKTITQELYRPNTLKVTEHQNPSDDQVASKLQPKLDGSEKYYEKQETAKPTEVSELSPTPGFVDGVSASTNTNREAISAQPTPYAEYERQNVFTGTSETYHQSEFGKTESPVTGSPVTVSGEQFSGFGSNEQYTSAFAEISKHHHFPAPTDSSKRQYNRFSEVRPTPEIAQHFQAPLPQEGFPQAQHSQEFEVKPTSNADFSENQKPTGTPNEQYPTGFAGNLNNAHAPDVSISSVEVSPSSHEVAKEQHNSDVSFNVPNAGSFEDQRTGSFISLHQEPSISEGNSQVQSFASSTEVSYQEYSPVTESSGNVEEPKNVHPSATPATVVEVAENPTLQNFKSESDISQINGEKEVSQDQGQEVDDNLSNAHRLKLTNPSIVKVRTRVRGKPRGQVNFAASQSTTPSSIVRNRYNENAEEENASKTNSFRDYQPVKTSKYNQYRGIKKPLRSTTESVAEYEQKSNVYTIRPQRRPLNPSTVSTKRIRRPTSPVPTVESVTEDFTPLTVRTYSHSQESEFSPSGVSNDVYYEHTSLAPFRQKFRKHYGSPEQKSDLVPDFGPTAVSSTIQTHVTSGSVDYSENANIVKDAAVHGNSDKYPEWNPSESGVDVSGIVLTTIRTPAGDDQSEVEPKKFQDSKKAFDPDLEKKSGRRRVRVRVHKKPHENFETAESQNLRTVANVLVPPTSTYKPIDESNVHQLAKNKDFSFGGQKLFGLRSREYFRKKLNLTQTESNVSAADDNKEAAAENEQSPESVKNVQESARVEGDATRPKIRGFVRKVEKSQKKDYEPASSQSTEENTSRGEAGKIGRTKVRGYVRKIIKHGDSQKEEHSESGEPGEKEESQIKHENVETHSRQHVRVNYGGFNQTGRYNGTRHRTIVRYVKKNKLRTSEDSHQESEGHQSEEQEQHQTTLAPTQQTFESESQETGTEKTKEVEVLPTHYPIYTTQQPETHETSEPDLPQTRFDFIQTTKSEAEPTEQTEIQPNRETTQQPEYGKIFQSLFHNPRSRQKAPKESNESETQETDTQRPQETEASSTQRPRVYQSLRPVHQRTQHSGFFRTREPVSSSTTESAVQESHERKERPVRPKHGKATTATEGEKSEEIKKTSEQSDQLTKNKNFHTFEIRKYLRTKSREGAFSQFTKNRHFTSEKAEVESTTKDYENEELTTLNEKITSIFSKTEPTPTESEPETTQAFIANTSSDEIQSETTKDDDVELDATTTEKLEPFTENIDSFKPDIKTELPTTTIQTSSSTENISDGKSKEVLTERNEILSETQPDIYRFSKSSFSFDETQKFAGTINRGHVRNITTDIIENTASFSAPGLEKRPEIHVHSFSNENKVLDTTESEAGATTNEKTEELTTEIFAETTTEYPETTENPETTRATEAVTKAKIAKLIKTSTTTKISHETEICYKGKCIRTKSENPDEDLKLLVDSSSSSTMKIPKTKT